MEFAAAVGQVLRTMRTDQDLTLHGVQALSKGAFKASALSGYERGERSISLEKFRELSALYGVKADRALRAVLELLDERSPPQVVDLTAHTIDLTERADVLGHHRIDG